MCGRYVRHGPKQRYASALSSIGSPQELDYPGSSVLGTWNMAPSQCSYVYRNEPWGKATFVSLYWGLLPFWAKESKGLQPINAQCETAHEKPMFRKLVRERRCLVAADGFYEWAKTATGKVPHYITHAGAEPIFFAGLWDCWHEGKGDARPTFTILTTEPNELVSKIHRPHAGDREARALRAVDGPCCARS